MSNLPARRVRQRMDVQPPTRVECRGHCKVVRTKYLCALAGKVSAITGLMHECDGRMDPHHVTTRGAGGGDETVIPLCRRAHDLLESWDRSQDSVMKEYGVDFHKMGAELWQADSYHRVKFEREWKETWGDVPLPYGGPG